MRAVANSVMAGLLLLQAVFGICCYSGVARACSAAGEVATSAHLACCDRCRSIPTDATTPPIHGDNEPICHGFCTYVKAETVNWAGCHDVLISLNPPLIGVQKPVIIGAEALRLGDLLEPSRPVRLHMLYQIILI